MRFLVLWWKGSSPQSTCKWRNMNHKRKICKYTTKYNYFMSTKRRCPLPWKVLCPGSYLQLLTWQLLRKSTDKVWGMVRAHRPRLKASAQAIHSYTLMCTVCTDSVQEQIAPKNTLHSTMLSENDTFFTVLKNTEKERVQVLGMTNWKDIAQIFLQCQWADTQQLSPVQVCFQLFLCCWTPQAPDRKVSSTHSPECSHIDTRFSNEATQCHPHGRLTDAGPQSPGACEILLSWKIPAAVAQPYSLNEFRLHS